MEEHTLSENIPTLQTVQTDGAVEGNETVRELQLTLLKRRRQCAKVKRKLHNCQAKLEKQDEILKTIQEKIVEAQNNRKDKTFNWASVKAAHLISKVFENCKPGETKPLENEDGDKNMKVNRNQNIENYPLKIENNTQDLHDNFEEETAEQKVKLNTLSNAEEPSKRKYTIDFHRFAIALYFFSPTTYIFLSKLIPNFPHPNYIRQWVTAGRVEKLFPPGVYRDDFNDS